MDEKVARLLEWRNGGKALPYSIEISPTLRCNLNCLFCWRYGKEVNYGNELTLREYKRVLKEAYELKVREIRIIGGGEPLLRKETFEIMKLVKRYGMFGYICTNGTLFSNEMIRTLVSIGWDHVKISLHAPCKKMQDFLAQQESFKRTVENIKNFVKFKKRFKTDKPRIEIGFVLNRTNFKEVIQMVRLANILKVQAFFIEPITAYSDMGKKLKLKKEEIKEFKKIAKNAYSFADNLETNLQQFFSTELIEKTGKMTEEIEKLVNSKRKSFLSVPCYEPWWRIGIRSDGLTCPCGFLDQNTTENVRENSLKDIWFGEYFETRRKQLLNKKLPNYCKRCCTTLVSFNQLIRNELSKSLV